MKSSMYTIVIAALATQHSDAFQPAISRKALFSKIGGSLIATSAVELLPLSSASAAESKNSAKARKRELLRGGKDMSDALHNGTDLNKGESAVASGLLDKMGLVDITPDKGSNNSRAPPTPKKS